MNLYQTLKPEDQACIRLGFTKALLQEAMKHKPEHQTVLIAAHYAPETFEGLLQRRRRGYAL